MAKGYGPEDYANWLSCKASYITKFPWTLYDGAVANPLVITHASPSQVFRLDFLATSAGNITTTGSLAGVTKVEHLTLVANVRKLGTYTFDTINSIACTCPSGTITVFCLNSTGVQLEHNSYTDVNLMWEDGGEGYWAPGGVFTTPTATAYVIEDIAIGTEIIYDKFHPHNPTNGIMYIIRQILVTCDEDGDIPLRTLKF